MMMKKKTCKPGDKEYFPRWNEERLTQQEKADKIVVETILDTGVLMPQLNANSTSHKTRREDVYPDEGGVFGNGLECKRIGSYFSIYKNKKLIAKSLKFTNPSSSYFHGGLFPVENPKGKGVVYMNGDGKIVTGVYGEKSTGFLNGFARVELADGTKTFMRMDTTLFDHRFSFATFFADDRALTLVKLATGEKVLLDRKDQLWNMDGTAYDEEECAEELNF